MRGNKIPLRRKIDFLFGFIILFILISSFYAYRHFSNLTAGSNLSIVLSEIKEKLADLNQLLKNTHGLLNDQTSRKAVNLQQDYINQRELIEKNISSLEFLSSANLKFQRELQSTRSLLTRYFETMEFSKVAIVFTKEGITIRQSLFAKIQDQLMYMRSGLEQDFMANTTKLDLIMKEGYVITSALILTLLLILTAFYLRLRYGIKIKNKKEAELIDKVEELEQINKNNKRVFSVIAHDLRSPFHPILMIAELLMAGGDEVEKDEIIELGRKLKTTGDNVLGLLDNLLAWSRARSGTLQFKSELFSLRETVNEAFTNLRMEAEKKEISDHNEVSENLWIISDHRILLLLLQNLISNALKFTQKGGKIRVTGKMENNNILISVIDTGIGMTTEIAKSLFTNSINPSSLGTDNEKGSGLGLLFCKEYVDLHSGKIWVESEPDKGSTFSFTIPVKALSNDGDLFTCYKVKHASTTNVGKNLISVRA